MKRAFRIATRLAASTMVLPVVAAPAAAQEYGRALVGCTGQIIDEIVVYAYAPTVSGSRGIPVVRDVARSVHVTTRPDVIQRFLLLQPGDACDDARRMESERVLRAQPFIADAGIVVVREHGRIILEVRTIDEAALVAGTRLSGRWPFLRRLRAGSGNVMGMGVEAMGEWSTGGSLRDGVGAQITDHQFLGSPFVMQFEARRAPLGGKVEGELMRPFLTGFQRFAWRVTAGSEAAYIDFEHPAEPIRVLRLEREWFDAGGVTRLGGPSRQWLVGGSLSQDREVAADHAQLFDPDRGVSPDSSLEFVGRYPGRDVMRANVFIGLRTLGFRRVRGLDALTATQDLPVGLQVGTQLGRALPRPAGDQEELFSASHLYVGAGDTRRAFRLEMQAEARRSGERDRWEGLLTSGRATHYYKPSPERTFLVSAEWSGARRQRIPFQLALGARDGGLRGYEKSRMAGARRGVLRVEDRHVLGPVGTLGELGYAFFADVGRVWSGEVPYGISSPIRASVGFSLLGAVPIGSARLWRLDVSAPLARDARRTVRVGVSYRDWTSLFWRDPSDVAEMRSRTVPLSIFRWP